MIKNKKVVYRNGDGEFLCNDEGKILPDKQALEMVEREHTEATPAEKWRLAQADTLLRAVGRC